MKNVLKITVAIFISLVFSCNKDDDEEFVGNWVNISDFEGLPRSNAVAFTIGSKGYLGTGYDGDDRLNDFWEYDPDLDYWVQKASLPDTAARNSAVGFGIGNKGYIGTGYDGENKLNDFWEYDVASNTWTKKADFGGSGRYSAIGFSINGKGYLGTGYDGNTLKDFWEYDPSTDVWTKKVSVGGSKRQDAVAFVIGDRAYVGTGINNGINEDDFWEYNPETDVWTQLNDIANSTSSTFDDAYTITRTNAVAFAINGKGYIATGGNEAPGTEVWEYDPSTDLWEEKTSFEGYERMDAVGFALGNRGYVITGRSSSYYFDDVWAFDPDNAYNEYD